MTEKSFSFGITKLIRGMVQRGIVDIKTIWKAVQDEYPDAKIDSARTVLYEERRRAGLPPPMRAGIYAAARELMARRKFNSAKELYAALVADKVEVRSLGTIQTYFSAIAKDLEKPSGNSYEKSSR